MQIRIFECIKILIRWHKVYQQIFHVVHVSVIQESLIFSEHNFMDTITHNILMVSHAYITLAYISVITMSSRPDKLIHWMLYNW